jgi:hypothetical protein
MVVAPALQIGRKGMAVKVSPGCLKLGWYPNSFSSSTMPLLGLVVDLSDLACHLVVTVRERANLDVIGSRPLLVGFDSSL